MSTHVNKPRPLRGNTYSAAIFSLLLSATVTGFAAEESWELEQDKQRIQVYTRPVAGSPFRAVKAVTVIDAPVANVIAALGDGSSCTAWREMCKSSSVLSAVSEHERTIHQVLDLPWPLADRDMVIHSVTRIDIETQSAVVYLEPASAELPELDYVRAESSGQFGIKVLGEKQVEFTYIMHSDLGGDLSPDIINSQLTSATFKDIRKLQAQVEN